MRRQRSLAQVAAAVLCLIQISCNIIDQNPKTSNKDAAKQKTPYEISDPIITEENDALWFRTYTIPDLFESKTNEKSAELEVSPEISFDSERSLTKDTAVHSGARSTYPMASLSDSFSLINLFNVFRGSESKLVDEKGDLIPLDEESISSSSLKLDHFMSPTSSQQASGSEPATLEHEDTSSTSDSPSAKRKLSAIAKKIKDTVRRKGSRGISSPVILVPGYGGSRLEAKLDKPSVVRYFCDHKSDWFDLWINVKLLLPYMIDCLIDDLRLEFDASTNTTHNTAGVEIRVKNGTQISSVEYLHSLPISGFAYFAPIIEQLVEAHGYQRDKNIRGAPYDFRKAPNELAHYFEQLKETSEQMFRESGKKAVTYICHSMGCNNMLFFLQRQPQDWKDKYVRRLISIAGPWAGSLSALRAAALGDDLGMPYLFSESKLIKVQRSLPSTIYLFPNKQAFEGVPLIKANTGSFGAPLNQYNSTGVTTSEEESETLRDNIRVPRDILDQRQQEKRPELEEEKYYMADDFTDFFEAIDHPDGYRMWLNTKDLLGSLEAPNVELWCFVGKGQKTLGRMEYAGEFPHSPNVELYDDGDGTVNLHSSSYCKRWSSEQKQPVYYKEFHAGHMEILKDEQIREQIERILDSETPKKKWPLG